MIRIPADQPTYSWWRFQAPFLDLPEIVEELQYWMLHYPGPAMWLARIAGYQGA